MNKYGRKGKPAINPDLYSLDYLKGYTEGIKWALSELKRS